jgi:phage tail-like protein
MDVNGTRFHLLFGEHDWLPGATAASPPDGDLRLEWHGDDQTLRLRELQPVLKTRSGAALDVESRVGATADRYGNLYWIAETGAEVRRLPRDRQASERFWPPLPGTGLARCAAAAGDFSVAAAPSATPQRFRGIAATPDHYLIVGTTSLPGMLVFDLFGGGAPLHVQWRGAFDPFDIVAGADGRVWILDRTHKAAWALSRAFQILGPPGPAPAPDFTPAAGTATVPPASPPIVREHPIPLNASVDPVAIEALSGDAFLILDNAPGAAHSVVQCYRVAGFVGETPLDHAAASAFETAAHVRLQVRGYDLAFLPQPATPTRGTLYVASQDGGQSFAYDLELGATLSLMLTSRLIPMRRFTGKGLVRIGNRISYDYGDRWAPLADQRQPRFEPSAEVRLPAWRGRYFDGKAPGCVWHRLLLDACIPPDAEVIVESRATDDRALFSRVPWEREPALYRRGEDAELPYYRPPLAGESTCTGTWELLFQRAKGRYLQLRLTLRGRGRVTPVLQALRVYYPRFSYLEQYLPGVYREDAVSASLLDRYLANVEGTFTALEGRLDALQVLFDPRTAPTESLEWLAGWLGLALEAGWSDAMRRLFVSHAATMLRERGTCPGLVRSVRVALERCADPSLFAAGACGTAAAGRFGVRIVERFRLRRAPGVVFGDPNDLLGPGSSSDASTWSAAQGAEPLHRKFRDFLAARYPDVDALNKVWNTTYTDFASVRFPAVDPDCGQRTRDWQAFTRGELGFVYARVSDADEPLYREFLARRYRQPVDLSAAYELSGSAGIGSFGEVRTRFWDALLRQRLPDGGKMLDDWIEFVSVILPTRRNAHRFTVMVPVTPNQSREEQQRRRGIADRVTTLEKPAHTVHDVKLYWGLFRVGEARTGFDSVLGPGSRSVALVLGHEALGATHVGFPDAQRARGGVGFGEPVAERAGCSCHTRARA